jgi:glycosyltransferase involved in cell wall biosynthesis
VEAPFLVQGADPSCAAPLRVAFLDSIPEWGGGQKWCVESALALARRGHQVLVGCARGGALELRAREAGLEVWSRRLLGPARLAALASFARLLRARRHEVVVANTGRDLRMAALAAGSSGPALVQRRGLARRLRRDPLTRWLYGRAVARVIANSEAIRAAMLRGADFVDPARFVVIPNGVALTGGAPGLRALARADLGLGDELAVGCVARLAPMKGHAHLLQAFAQVRARVPAARLLLAGEGEQEGALRASAQALGLAADAVRFLGFVRDPERLLAGLDLFVLPSVRDEGVSNALLEAMASGLACVVSDAGGLAEAVVDGRTGRVVPAGDEGALAVALTELLGDGERRAAMGAAGRARVAERYSFEVVTVQLERLLLELRAERKA